MRYALTALSLLSAIFFPWPATVLIVLLTSLSEPLVPLAAGLFIDTLYYNGGGHHLPLFTLCGALVTLVALYMRSRLRPTL